MYNFFAKDIVHVELRLRCGTESLTPKYMQNFWLIRMRHASFICETWLTHMRHDSFIWDMRNFLQNEFEGLFLMFIVWTFWSDFCKLFRCEHKALSPSLGTHSRYSMFQTKESWHTLCSHPVCSNTLCSHRNILYVPNTTTLLFVGNIQRAFHNNMENSFWCLNRNIVSLTCWFFCFVHGKFRNIQRVFFRMNVKDSFLNSLLFTCTFVFLLSCIVWGSFQNIQKLLSKSLKGGFLIPQCPSFHLHLGFLTVRIFNGFFRNI